MTWQQNSSVHQAKKNIQININLITGFMIHEEKIILSCMNLTQAVAGFTCIQFNLKMPMRAKNYL